MAILIRSSTMTPQQQQVAKPPQIISYPLTHGLLQRPRSKTKEHQWDPPVHLLKKWPWWTSWSSSSVSSTSARKQPSLVSKRWEGQVAWALNSSPLRIWTSIARLTLRATLSTLSRLTRVRASITCSCRRNELIWTRPTRREGKSGRLSSFKSARTSWSPKVSTQVNRKRLYWLSNSSKWCSNSSMWRIWTILTT